MNARQILFVIPCLLLGSNAYADELSREEINFFESKIRPVLIRECYGCHSNQAGNVRGGLKLDTKELMLIGGSSGPAVVPGDLEESMLFNAIIHEDFVMPPKRKLPDDVIEDFRKWIEMGAPDPRVTSVAEIRTSITQEDIQDAKQNFWAYKHPSTPTIPTTPRDGSEQPANWAKTDIDRFIARKLDEAGMTPAPDAEPERVLRRLCFDLVGLPPSLEQTEYFNALWEKDPDEAIEFVVDRLMQQEQFGERWGRHWLDVARYAESTGREVNMTYPEAWRYRDYVIDSFNNDKPFDRFIQEQLAGDLLPVETDEEWASNLVATTFLAIGPKNVNEQNPVQFAADVADEQIDVTTRVFLGMSVSCARCHDHKFDAIPQTDYYALAGVFRNMKTYFGNAQSELGRFSGAQNRRSSNLLLLPVEDPNPYDERFTRQELEELREEIQSKKRSLASLRGNRNEGNQANAQRQRIQTLNELQVLSSRLGAVDESGEPKSFCMGVQEEGRPTDARVLVRGEIDQPGQSVSRGFPQVLCDAPIRIPANSSGRLQLAQWIGSDQNPLTARVMANRIWLHLIGQGIVTSTENFGVTGQPPSHPELLDYLAVEFVDSGWSVKSLVRQIATSRVYRISSGYNQDYHEQDPDNHLLWRANPRRLDAEAIRDAMLYTSGRLDLQRPRGSEVAKAGYTRVNNGALGNPRDLARKAFEEVQSRMRQSGSRPGSLAGRGRFGRQAAGRFAGAGNSRESMQDMMQDVARKITNQLDMEDSRFRSVYLPIVRDEEPRSLEVFDLADSSAIIGVRESSNTANQALYLMNNPFVISQSESLADRISKNTSSVRQQIEQAFLIVYGRLPTSGERSATEKFVRSFSGGVTRGSAAKGTLAALCQSLYGSAEFRYID